MPRLSTGLLPARWMDDCMAAFEEFREEAAGAGMAANADWRKRPIRAKIELRPDAYAGISAGEESVDLEVTAGLYLRMRAAALLFRKIRWPAEKGARMERGWIDQEAALESSDQLFQPCRTLEELGARIAAALGDSPFIDPRPWEDAAGMDLAARAAYRGFLYALNHEEAHCRNGHLALREHLETVRAIANRLRHHRGEFIWALLEAQADYWAAASVIGIVGDRMPFDQFQGPDDLNRVLSVEAFQTGLGIIAAIDVLERNNIRLKNVDIGYDVATVRVYHCFASMRHRLQEMFASLGPLLDDRDFAEYQIALAQVYTNALYGEDRMARDAFKQLRTHRDINPFAYAYLNPVDVPYMMRRVKHVAEDMLILAEELRTLLELGGQ